MTTSNPVAVRREWAVALIVALIATGLTTVPYALGYLTVQEGSFFTGLLMNPEDSQTYFAKMMQGYDGQLLYTIPFTPEPHQAALVGVFYVWLGYLGRLLNVTPPLLWQWSRLLASLFLFLATFRFIASFIPQSRTRWIAYLLSIFGSGLGWLLFLFNQPYWLDAFPVDFKQPGAHLFFTALTFPHVAFGTALTLLSIGTIGRAVSPSPQRILSWRQAIVAGIIHAVLGITYPFLIYLSIAVAILIWLYQVWRARRILWQRGLIIALMFVIPAPLFLYYAYTLQANPVFRAWDLQAGTPALPWPHYLLAYGPMLLLAALVWWKRPATRQQYAVLWIWILTVALLLYAPLRPQRRFVQGVHVPLAILATIGLDQVALPWLQQRRCWQLLAARPRYSTAGMNRFVTSSFLLFMSLSNVYVLASVSLSAVVQQPDGLFRPISEQEVTAWLRLHSDADAVVLGDYQTGNFVAAHSGRSVVLGHWAETMDYEAKRAEVARFFAAETSDAWRQTLLDRYRVGIVWYGPRERALGSYDPWENPQLTPVHSAGGITLFAVEGQPAP